MSNQWQSTLIPRDSSIRVAIFGACSVIIFGALAEYLFDPFTALLPAMLVLMIWLCSMICALVKAWGTWRTQPVVAFIPIVILLASIPIAYFPNWLGIMLDLNFKMKLRAREEIVQQVIDGKLKSNSNNNFIVLPDGYTGASRGGEIEVERTRSATRILFYTYLGILDARAGFMYCSDGADPPDRVMGDLVVQKKRMAKNWYRVSLN